MGANNTATTYRQLATLAERIVACDASCVNIFSSLYFDFLAIYVIVGAWFTGVNRSPT